MLRLIGVMCSCIVTGYVFFDVMESLYERKFSYNKLTFTGIYVIYVILSVGIAWFGIPILNVLFSTLLLYGLSKSLYIAHDKSILILKNNYLFGNCGYSGNSYFLHSVTK